MQVDDDALIPVQGAIPMNPLSVIFHHKAFTVGQSNMKMVAVLVVMQEVAFGGFDHHRAWVILSSKRKSKKIH